jgi:hypothetical protein
MGKEKKKRIKKKAWFCWCHEGCGGSKAKGCGGARWLGQNFQQMKTYFLSRRIEKKKETGGRKKNENG